MKNSTIIKLIALNREVTVSEETFTIKELKDKYPKLWLNSRGDYQVFVNSCIEKWGNEIESPWNVVSYCLE